MKVLIAHHHPFELWHAPPWLSERLRGELSGHEFVQLEDYKRVASEIGDADVFIGWSLPAEHLRAARELKWIHSPAAAVHQLMYPELIASRVIVTNSTGVHGPVVAEHAIAVMLALAKRLPQAVRYQLASEWAQQKMWSEHPRPREVDGATVAVIGMGGIGSEFTRRAKALGMTVLAVRENPDKGTSGADHVFAQSQLDDVLPKADYVVLCTPVTPATTGLINLARIQRMKPDAYLINVGRGPLVVESDLVQALAKSMIAGAGLDVFDQEPLPPASPLWKLENVLITPHTAAVTERLWERHYRFIVENMKRFVSGGPLLNEVDKQRGY